jgi:hypothetical protein
MSWFPSAEMSDNLTYPSPHTECYRTSPSPRPLENSHTESDANPDNYRAARGASWHAPIPHGLGLITLPVTTESSYVTTTTLDPFTNDDSCNSLGWPSEFSSSAPPTCQPVPLRKDSWSDQSCNPLSTILPAGLWDYLRPTSSSIGGYDTSPGRSDYTRSSHPSAVSSPYAHSEIYVPAVDSPKIKIESDHPIPQIHFSAEDAYGDQRDQLAAANEAMKVDETSIEERVRTRLSSYSSSDIGDCKTQDSQIVFRRANSLEAFHSPTKTQRPRQKRRRTKLENANFYCDLCARPFQRAFNLRSHNLNVHNPNRTKPHVCEYDGCTHKFSRKTDLIRHVGSVCTCSLLQMLTLTTLQVHQKLRDFKCDLCGKDFPRKDTLMRSVPTLRPVYQFQC